MKAILLSDLHIVPDGGDWLGINPLSRLQAAVDDIIASHADAEVCIVLGDIADNGDIATYQLAAAELARLPMPFYLLPGNHDVRDNMGDVFEMPQMQQVVSTTVGDFILLDSVCENSFAGEFCEKRGQWLAQVLRAATRPVFICIHHPPLCLSLPEDKIMLHDTRHLIAALEQSSVAVRHFFFGHIHATVNGVWRSVPFAALRSLVHQSYFTVSPDGPAEIYTHAAAHYGVFIADDEQVVSHHHGFLENIAVGHY